MDASVSPLACPHCASTNVVGYGGIKGQAITDLPSDGKPTVVVIDRRRYRCNACRKTFLERLIGIDENRSITRRLITHVEQQCLFRPFLTIAKDVALAESTIRNIFNEYVARLDKSIHFATPVWLGIDEIHAVNKPRYILANIHKLTIIDMLEDLKPETIERSIGKIQDKGIIKSVAVCLDDACLDTVRALLPGASISLGKTYIVNSILRLLNDMRKTVRANLQWNESRYLAHDKEILLNRYDMLTDSEKECVKKWEGGFKKLIIAYWLKESICELLNKADKQYFMSEYLRWENDVLADGIKEFNPFLDMVNKWQREIFALFDYPVPDDYIEAVEKFRGAMKGLSRGYSFNAVRAKILSADELRSEDGICIVKLTELLKTGQF